MPDYKVGWPKTVQDSLSIVSLKGRLPHQDSMWMCYMVARTCVPHFRLNSLAISITHRLCTSGHGTTLNLVEAL